LAKKRLIFTLLYDNGSFMLSRNFRLQKIGDLKWLETNYGFSEVGYSIDELIVLDVSRTPRDRQAFCETLKALTFDCFAPIAAGGGVNSVNEAHDLLRSGADKVVVNTALHTNPDLISKLATEFGRQCIVASLDCKYSDNAYRLVTNNGSETIDLELPQFLAEISSLPVGEIYLNSVDRDGTGNGYDFKLLDCLPKSIEVPVILAGGVGNSKHLAEGLSDHRVDAVATANLLNFMGNGLALARAELINTNFDLPVFIEY
jgi:cyclase